jgi:hypothetical protein
MKHEARCHRISERSGSDWKPFKVSGRRLNARQTHSSLRSQQLPARHPKIGQCKQRHQLRRVLGKALVADLGESKLTFDDPKRMLHLGSYAGLELFSLFAQSTPWCVLLHLALVRAHGHSQSTPVASTRFGAPW